MSLKTVLIVFALLLTEGLCPRGASADRSREVPPPKAAYELDPAIEVPVFVVSSVATFGLLFSADLGRSDCAPLCDESGVNGLERWQAGRYDTGWRLVSDISLISVLGSGAVVLVAGGGLRAGLWDGVVVAESLAVTLAGVTLLKVAVGRSRPYLYTEEAPAGLRNSRDGGQSFPSGHVALSAALTTSVFSVLRVRHPDSPWPWVALSVGTAATGFVAAGRVMAGKHFVTDVIAGAAVGALIGVAIPAVHRKRSTTVVPVASSSGGGLFVVGRF